MNIRTGAVILAAATWIAGCSTSPAPPPPDAASFAPGSKFETLADGSVWHPASKGRCPAVFLGIPYKEPHLFKPDGTDVSCNFEDAAGTTLITAYFFQWPAPFDSPEATAQEGVRAIEARFTDAELLVAESEACSLRIDLLKMLDAVPPGGFLQPTDTVVGETPCHVYRIGSQATILATDMIGPWHLKIRLTGPVSGDDVAPLYEMAASAMRLQYGWMSGYPADFHETRK